MQDKVLVIDTVEHRLRETVTVMQSRGFLANGTASADEAVGVIAHDQPNCIVLGNLPAQWSRRSYCELLRRLLSDPHALIFTVDEADSENAGERWFQPLFDDVLPCTSSGYCLGEIAVTLLIACKRHEALLSHGGFSLNVETMRLSGFGGSININPQIAAIMTLLIRAPDIIHSREEIRQTIAKKRPVQVRSVDVYIKRLRNNAKLGGLPNPVETIHGRGYRLPYYGMALG
ncbi:winged helix-turn-helix transcriptional regulator [Sphingobium chungangianum]